MIIMRIFRCFGVDIRSLSYQHSLGTIDDFTIVKSLLRQPNDTPTPPRAKRPSTSSLTLVAATAPPVPTQAPPTDTSEDDASVTSIYREQQRLSSEQEHISLDLQRIIADQHNLRKKYSKLSRLVKAIFDKLGAAQKANLVQTNFSSSD